MDGMHDLGGRQGFGPVNTRKRAAFTEEWERQINAITGNLVTRKLYNMDEYRHAIERMEPRHYVGASYFERVFTCVATLCIEKGVFSKAQLDAAAGEDVPLSLPSAPGRTGSVDAPDFGIGDRVTVKAEYIPGHIRVPAYVRGKSGVVVGLAPAYPFPDAAAHGLNTPKQRVFDVRFEARDLWPDGAEDAAIHVGLFHGYLTRA